MRADFSAIGSRLGHAGRWLGARVMDLLYPSDCALCGTLLSGRHALCDSCAGDLPRIVDPFCRTCGMTYEGIIDHAFECPNCSGLNFAFEFARPAMLKDPRTLDLIHQLKYRRSLHLAHELGRLAVDAFRNDPRLATALAEKWPLIPVPLHRGRLLHRHFNQAEEIARGIAHHTDLPIFSALRRTRDTGTQTRLTRKQRMKNLQGSFEISKTGKKLIRKNPHGAVLIDDVLTTGSTVNECAKTLRREGIRKVVVVTVMRG
jgi:ComF family protein